MTLLPLSTRHDVGSSSLLPLFSNIALQMQEDVEANVVAYNAAISACQRAGKVMQARLLLERMPHRSLKANAAHLNLDAFCACFVANFLYPDLCSESPNQPAACPCPERTLRTLALNLLAAA